jgi:hypothetical protein
LEDLRNGVVWWIWTILLKGFLLAGAYLVASHGFRQPSGMARWLATALLAWAWAILGIELLGLLDGIGRATLLLWTLAFLVAGLALGFHQLAAAASPKPWPRGSWDLSATIALALLICCAVWLGARALLQAVKVVSDGPIYHLYFAVKWWKAGRLFLIPTPFGENAAPYFPANGDLWFTWLTVCWGGDRLARVGQAPFLLLAGLAAFALARRLGAATPAAVIATCWFLSCTPLLLFSFEPNVDTIFLAAYLLAVYFLVLYWLGDGQGQTLALACLAAGGALGTKATGVVFLPPLLLLGAFGVWRRQKGLSRRFAHLAILALTPLVLSGYWFARNAWLTGNPLYPLHLTMGGKTLLAGWYGPEVMQMSQYYLPRDDWRSALDILLAVLDPRLAPVWALALAGLWALRGKGLATDRWVWVCAALAVLNIGLYWVLIPYRTQQRFMLHALGLAAVPLARLLDRAGWLRACALVLLALHVATPQTWPFAAYERDIPWDLNPRIPNALGSVLPLLAAPGARSGFWSELAIWIVALGAGALVVAWCWGRLIVRPTRGRLGLAALASSGLMLAAGLMVYPWNREPRWQFYPWFPDYNRGWANLELLSHPEGSRVAYAGTNLPYYLMASGLRNDVRYVNIDAHPDWLLHDYHRQYRESGHTTWNHPRPGWDRIHPNFEAWLANLRAAGIQLLVVARANPAEGPANVADPQSFPVERGWAEGHPKVFTPLYGVSENDPQFRIYAVNASESHTAWNVTDAASRSH